MRGRPRIRPWLRTPRRRGPRPERGSGRLLALVIGVGLALAVIFLIDSALRPTLTALAQARVENAVTRIVNDAVDGTLTSEAISYSDLVTLEKDAAGQVSVLAANTAQLNALRTEILGKVLAQVEQLDSQELGVPLGSLTGFATASDLGPVLPVRVLTAAVPTADFENVFTSTGINQTLHRIMLNVRVECTLLIPGGTVDTAVEAQVCAAETLLVGQVPDAYLELPGNP
ncbi:MAG TPA: sporulation protein YunB [Candidatus Flavonifractor avistercoris]|nr:sporulation protein YunB [Candidatus Flavonifractor avistercoris]